jgi:hypothetical protein
MRYHSGEAITQPLFRFAAHRGAGLGVTAVICAALGAVLAGCGSSGPGSVLVDPGAYDAYHCNDLVREWGTLNKREEQLRNLMSRASQGGGTVIGTLTYGADYQTVLAQKKLLQQVAAEKNCELVATFKSDQTIR